MTSIRVLVNGAEGRMGQFTVKAIAEDPALDLVGKAGRLDNLGELIKATQAQVVVDFTVPDSAFINAETIIEAGARPVIGTTGGLSREQIALLGARCLEKNVGGVIAPNFSIGVILMMKYAREMATYFPDVEIIEMHHDGKVDSPSGTAMFTAEQIASAAKVNSKQKTSRESIPHARGANHHGIPIHAIRLPGLVAHQQIIFGGPGETLTLRHDSIDRQCFMPGVLLACKKVMGLRELVVGLEKLL